MSLQGEKGNSLLTDDIIVKEALRLLKNNLVAAPLVHRSLEKVFGKVGDVIRLEKPYRVKSASGRVLKKQPMVDQTVPFKINHHEHVGLEFTVRDRTLTIQAFSERYLKSGIVQIANKIDESIILEGRKAYFSSGTPGTALNTKAFMFAKAYMNKVGIPQDGMRRAILDPIDCAEISDDIKGHFNEAMVKGAIQKGYMGPLSEFDTFESSNMWAHTVGSYGGTPLVNGADQTEDTLTVDGFAGGSTLNVGDAFTIDGVFEINPQNYKSTGRLQHFVVTEAFTADGGGAGQVKISPSINDGTLTTVDVDGNAVSLAAYQNVTNAPADNAAITVVGNADTTYRQSLLFHRDAIALAMVDLVLPKSATVKARVRDADSGLSMSMTGAYDVNQHTEVTRIDAVWGTDMIYPDLAHRIWSSEG